MPSQQEAAKRGVGGLYIVVGVVRRDGGERGAERRGRERGGEAREMIGEIKGDWIWGLWGIFRGV
jgi:hypothetical protein